MGEEIINSYFLTYPILQVHHAKSNHDFYIKKPMRQPITQVWGSFQAYNLDYLKHGQLNAHEHIMENHICWNHTTLQLKLKNKLIYNYSPIIPWVLQLLCNYPFRIWCINK
jgi:hypothetical protein